MWRLINRRRTGFVRLGISDKGVDITGTQELRSSRNSIVRPIPPANVLQDSNRVLIKSPLYNTGGIAGDDRVGGNIFRYNGAGAYDRSIADRDSGEYKCAVA